MRYTTCDIPMHSDYQLGGGFMLNPQFMNFGVESPPTVTVAIDYHKSATHCVESGARIRKGLDELMMVRRPQF